MVTLQAAQAQMGATHSSAVAAGLVPASFGNDGAAIAAARTGVAIVDRSHWHLLRLTGDDRASFLHNQSTADIKALQPGSGTDTVLVTATARMIDLATVAATEATLELVVSPGMGPDLYRRLDRYIFPADRVKLAQISNDYAILSLLGPASAACLAQIGLDPGNLANFSHRSAVLPGAIDLVVRVQAGSGLALPGYTLWVARDRAGELWEAIAQAGALPLGESAWEQLRIEQGRPKPGCELTEDYNPLEACLWSAVSLNKGCYIGQEAIARLDTYKGVKLNLWGFALAQVVDCPAPIRLGEDKVGTLTSCVATELGAIGLGYLRTKVGGAGLSVTIEGQATEAIDLPFATRDRIH
ncbi:MAG: folate-binding protein [Oscillatoriales cyanobacterium]|nr:MAG: folate-binding protein [Oscillatoriales cyanobacterium]